MSDEKEELKAMLEEHGIEVPHQWGVKKMQSVLDELTAAPEVPEGVPEDEEVSADEELEIPHPAAPKPRPVQRAKSHVEEEAERKAAEEAAAKAARAQVQRAATLQETDLTAEEGDPDKVVQVRITKKGEGRVQTGEMVGGRPEFYAKGEIVEMNEASAKSNEAKGYVEIE